ncbi:Protein of unknown function, partial [Gryllus bimaculatus]
FVFLAAWEEVPRAVCFQGKGRLRLREGSMGDLRNVFRKAPVTLRRALVEGRPALLLSFSGGFRFVDVHYRYQYSIPLISHSGYVQVTFIVERRREEKARSGAVWFDRRCIN